MRQTDTAEKTCAQRRFRARCLRCCARTSSAHAPPPSASTGCRQPTWSRKSTKRLPNCGRWWPSHPRDPARVEEEMGDLLFSIVNLARKLGIEPEAALRVANDKFQRRFEGMERSAGIEGKVLRDLKLAELEALWLAEKRGHEEHEDTKQSPQRMIRLMWPFRRSLLKLTRRPIRSEWLSGRTAPALGGQAWSRSTALISTKTLSSTMRSTRCILSGCRDSRSGLVSPARTAASDGLVRVQMRRYRCSRANPDQVADALQGRCPRPG